MDIADGLYELEESYGLVSLLSNFEVYSFLSDCVWSDLHTRKSLRNAFYYIDKYDLRRELIYYIGPISRKIRKVRKLVERQIKSDEYKDFRRALYIAVFLEYREYFNRHSLFFFVNEYGRK